MINPVSSSSNMLAMQATARTSKAASAPAASASVDSPVTESRESAATESSETTAQKNAEAMRSLASQESTQLQSIAPKNIFSAQSVIKAYQQ